MIDKINKIFTETSTPAIMNDKAVIVNVGKIFRDMVIAVENTLKSEGVVIGESYWHDGLYAYVIPVVKK